MIESGGELLVITTFATEEHAARFARKLVERRLAACATCLPGARSIFRWQSEAVSEESEVVLLIKTHKQKLAELESCFAQEHPYETPELLVVEAAAVSAAYGKWMRENLNLKPTGDA